MLQEGERLVGEWLAQAHATRNELIHEPFVAFDLMRKHDRTPIDIFTRRVSEVDFLVKFVRPEKEDGIFLPETSGIEAVWNWHPAISQKIIKKNNCKCEL